MLSTTPCSGSPSREDNSSALTNLRSRERLAELRSREIRALLELADASRASRDHNAERDAVERCRALVSPTPGSGLLRFADAAAPPRAFSAGDGFRAATAPTVRGPSSPRPTRSAWLPLAALVSPSRALTRGEPSEASVRCVNAVDAAFEVAATTDVAETYATNDEEDAARKKAEKEAAAKKRAEEEAAAAAAAKAESEAAAAAAAEEAAAKKRAEDEAAAQKKKDEAAAAKKKEEDAATQEAAAACCRELLARAAATSEQAVALAGTPTHVEVAVPCGAVRDSAAATEALPTLSEASRPVSRVSDEAPSSAATSVTASAWTGKKPRPVSRANVETGCGCLVS